MNIQLYTDTFYRIYGEPTQEQMISHYESRLLSIEDRKDSYQWQVDEADKVIKNNQEWKEHSLEKIKKAKEELVFVANQLDKLKEADKWKKL